MYLLNKFREYVPYKNIKDVKNQRERGDNVDCLIH